MTLKPKRYHMAVKGMTLSEVVIAIAIIAFTIPLILAASGGAQHTRQAAEADTRSAWLVRDVQRRITNEWSEATQNSDHENAFPFPTPATPEVTIDMCYMKDGRYIPEDIDQAVYLVTVKAEQYTQSADYPMAAALARITIEIQYPANASSNNLKKLTYQYLSARVGML